MKITTKKYTEQLNNWPKSGHHIMAQYNEQEIIVYQSYRPEIGHFAAKNQYFGGAFSLEIMTWIKPNFLWMMYRNGWGTKQGQEVTLAIHLKMEAFIRYLQKAEYSSFKADKYTSHDDWKERVKTSSVRLQWDPDHDLYGAKEERRAIQIGVRNEETVAYSKEDILQIEDISKYVNEQYQFVLAKELDKLELPEEKPLVFEDDSLNKKLNLER